MQKWEYLSSVAQYIPENNQLCFTFVNGKELRDPIPLYDYLQRAGEQGWELISEQRVEEKSYECGWCELEPKKDYDKSVDDWISAGWELQSICISEHSRFYIYRKENRTVSLFFRFKRPAEE